MNLENNLISDVSGLSSLVPLQILRLNHNKIEKIDGGSNSRGFAQLVNLEMLYLGYNKVTNIASLNLKGMAKLKVCGHRDGDENVKWRWRGDGMGWDTFGSQLLLGLIDSLLALLVFVSERQ